jgi:hypothetical protein
MVIYLVEEILPKYFYNKKYPHSGDHVASVAESKRNVGRGIE